MVETDDRSEAPEADETPSAPVKRRGRWFLDVFLLALVPLAGVLAYIRLDERIAFGPSWDTYAFLDNAADMVGRSVGYVEPHRPPFMSFLTSLVMRAGAWDVSSIQIVDVALSFLGILAFYALLRRRFERPLAALASVLLLLVPPLWAWLGSGYTDFPSVALSICAMFLLVKATEDHPRWYWVAFPVLLFAILTRFGAILMVFPALLWLALRAKPFEHAKQILTGLGLTALAYVPVGLYYNGYYGDPFFPFSFVSKVADVTIAGGGASAAKGLFVIPGWYYIKNVMGLLFSGPSGLWETGFLIVTLLGLAGALVATLLRQRSLWRALLPLAAVAAIVATEFVGGSIARVAAITGLGLVLGIFLIPRERAAVPATQVERRWRRFRRSDTTGALALDLTMLVWGLLFLDAHGHMQPQIDRYFITMAPAALYFVVLGWRAWGVPLTAIGGLFRNGLRYRPDSSSRLAATVGVLGLAAVTVLGSWMVFARYSPTARTARDPIVQGAEETAKWMLANDPDIHATTIVSDVWPLTSWYLGQEAYPMPTFETLKAFPVELEKNRVEYYVTIRSRRYAGYKTVFGAASTTVLKYQSTFPRAVPAVAYLGDGWDAYVEQLCNFDFDLYFSSRRQVGTGTWLLDRMSADELAQYDAIAVFGAHWRDKAVAEKTLRTYVQNGGVVVIDASQNMDGFSYPLVDTVFMDVLVRRKKLPASSLMKVSPQLAADSRVPAVFPMSPLVDENGGPWYGANYEPAPWAQGSGQTPATFEVLATVGSEPAVLLERLGKGRIYWLSNNLVWHAYYEGSDNEVRLVRGVFRQAVGLPATPAAEVEPDVTAWFVSRKLRPAAAAARVKAKAAAAAGPAVLPFEWLPSTGFAVPHED